MRSLLVPCGYLTIRAGQWTTEGKWQVMSQSDGMSLQSLLLRQQDPGHFGKSLGLCPPQKLGGTSGLSYSSPGHPWSQWSMPHQPGRITVLLCNHSQAASPSPDCLPGGKKWNRKQDRAAPPSIREGASVCRKQNTYLEVAQKTKILFQNRKIILKNYVEI